MPALVSTDRSKGTEPSHNEWIDAAPFRSHLRHLMAVGDLSSSAVAVLSGVSPTCAHRLLFGRAGRPLRRISPEVARKLLRVTTADVRALQRRKVPAPATARHLDQLLANGWTVDEVAQVLRLQSAEVHGILSGTTRSCSQLVSVRAAAEVSVLMPLMGSPARGRAAA